MAVFCGDKEPVMRWFGLTGIAWVWFGIQSGNLFGQDWITLFSDRIHLRGLLWNHSLRYADIKSGAIKWTSVSRATNVRRVLFLETHAGKRKWVAALDYFEHGESMIQLLEERAKIKISEEK